MPSDSIDDIATTRIRPASKPWTDKANEPVTLRMYKDGLGAEKPVSVPELLYRTSITYPEVAALKYKDPVNKEWQTVTYQQYRENVLRISKAFIKLGLEPRRSVGILAFNSPEWFYSEWAAIHAG